MTETPRDEGPRKPPVLHQQEIQRVFMALSDLREFHHGYIHGEHLAREGSEPRALHRFLGTALVTYLDGFYPADRSQGLLPILRLVCCDTLANEIEEALDTAVGKTTFRQIMRTYRNKAVAHPQFTGASMKDVVEHYEIDLGSAEAVAAFRRADHDLKRCTAAAYEWFRRVYPDLVQASEEAERLPELGGL